MKIIIKNQAKCKKCGELIVCESGHEPVTCSCGNLTVDGKRGYITRCIQSGQASWVKQSAYAEFDGSKNKK